MKKFLSGSLFLKGRKMLRYIDEAQRGKKNPLSSDLESLTDVINDCRSEAIIYQSVNGSRLARLKESKTGYIARGSGRDREKILGTLPSIYPEWLGSQSFLARCECRFAYVVGEMARGIATSGMVVEAAKAGFVGFFGSAGLKPSLVAKAIQDIRRQVEADSPWGMNLIHSPDRPEQEIQMIDLFLREKVRNVSASAFMSLSKEIVRYSAAGLTRGSTGEINRATNVFAKISRPEIAKVFLTPPPSAILNKLVSEGSISEEQAELQSKLPTAEFLTIEADSGGHTDGRPLTSLFPAIVEVRDRAMREHGYSNPILLGAAGGIGTPTAAAAAFAMGADYIVTGSVNQSAVESGLSNDARALLCKAEISDFGLAPAADMFEVGAKVQVLKRGTMFAATAQRLQEFYRLYGCLADFTDRDKQWLEEKVLRMSFEEAWHQTRSYHAAHNKKLSVRADTDDRVKLALVFKRFLFQAAKWARDGVTDRRADYQIWCGPAMGAFNEWVKGSFLDYPTQRTVRQIGLNIMEGAAIAMRAQQCRSLGVVVPSTLFSSSPQILDLA